MNYLKIDEFAKLCRTTKDTLHWYDKLGVLKPNSRGDNGYRYYTAGQILDFDLITTLTKAGCSLSDIAQQFDSSNNNLLNSAYYENKLAILKQQIMELQQNQLTLEGLSKCIAEAQNCVFNRIKLTYYDEIRLIVTNYSERSVVAQQTDDDVATHVIKSRNTMGVSMYPHISVIPTSSIQDSVPRIIYHANPAPLYSGTDLMVIKSGIFLEIYQRGDVALIGRSLKVIRDYLRMHNLSATGNIICFDLITGLVRGSAEQSVLKILVPID